VNVGHATGTADYTERIGAKINIAVLIMAVACVFVDFRRNLDQSIFDRP
jgi:hypothetical protein